MTTVTYSLEKAAPANALGSGYATSLVTTGTGAFLAFAAPDSHVYGRALNASLAPNATAFPFGEAGDAQSAVLSNGNVVTAYTQHDVAHSTYHSYFQITTPAGVPVVGQTPIAGSIDSIAALTGGGFALFYHGGSGSTRYLYDSSGNKVPGSSLLRGSDPELAGLTNGGYVAAYHTADGVFARIYGTDPEAPSLAVPIHFTHEASFGTDAIGLKDGGFAVAYTIYDPNGRDEIWLRILNADGTPRSSALHVDSPDVAAPGAIAGSQDGPSLTQLKNGDIAIGWTTVLGTQSDISDIDVRVFTPTGHVVTGITHLAHTQSYEEAPLLTALADGQLGTAWSAYVGAQDSSIVTRTLDLVRTSVGAKGADKVKGDELTDHILGKGGKDKLYGGDGGDRITGGAGADKMHAGKDDARDVFVFNPGDGSDSHFSRDWDHVYQFDNHSKHEAVWDKLDLSGLGVKWGNITLDEHGKGVKVEVDYKGSGNPDMIIDVLHVDHLHKADFIL